MKIGFLDVQNPIILAIFDNFFQKKSLEFFLIFVRLVLMFQQLRNVFMRLLKRISDCFRLQAVKKIAKLFF